MFLNYFNPKLARILFKYRGQFPIIFFFIAIPFVMSTNYTNFESLDLILKLSIFLSLVGLSIRFYIVATTPKGTSGRNTKKQIARELNITGLYSVLRHPIYIGNYFIWLGVAITSFNLYFILIITLFFFIYYHQIIKYEDFFLKRKFGDSFLKWSSTTHSIVPKISQFKPSILPFSYKSIIRREYSTVLSVVISFVYMECLRNYSMERKYLISNDSLFFLTFIVFIVVLIKLLRYTTNLLEDDNRS